jgi:hypothetical protein
MNDDENITRTIIPAPPDWYVALFIPEKDSLHLSPIVACEIERTPYGYPIPITLDGNMEDDVTVLWAIKTPDGKYVRSGDVGYDTEAAAIAGMKKMWLKRKAYEKERIAAGVRTD